MPAALVAAGTRRLSSPWAATLLVLCAPLLGYVNVNPPLAGMVIATVLATPLVVAYVDGRAAATQSLRTLMLAIPLLLAASAYWIVPSILYASDAASHGLAAISSWDWTESRANIRNAFWLNSTWAWAFPEYHPYAAAYDMLPTSLLRFALPALAFSAL